MTGNLIFAFLIAGILAFWIDCGIKEVRMKGEFFGHLALVEAIAIVILIWRIVWLESRLAILRKASGQIFRDYMDAKGFKRAHNDDPEPLGEVVIPPFLGSERR